jgi:hypothetical protein
VECQLVGKKLPRLSKELPGRDLGPTGGMRLLQSDRLRRVEMDCLLPTSESDRTATILRQIATNLVAWQTAGKPVLQPNLMNNSAPRASVPFLQKGRAYPRGASARCLHVVICIDDLDELVGVFVVAEQVADRCFQVQVHCFIKD